MTEHPVAVWVLGAAAIIVAVIVLFKAVVGFLRFVRGIAHFFDDWFGEVGRPGVPARPGVMAQLHTMREEQAATASRLAAIEHELHPNSGGSLRDVVDRVEQKVTDQTG